MILSIYAVSTTIPTAVLVIGLSPYALCNDPLQSFFNLLANQMGKGLLAATVSTLASSKPTLLVSFLILPFPHSSIPISTSIILLRLDRIDANGAGASSGGADESAFRVRVAVSCSCRSLFDAFSFVAGRNFSHRRDRTGHMGELSVSRLLIR